MQGNSDLRTRINFRGACLQTLMESELIVAPPRVAAAVLDWRAWLILQVVLARRSRPPGRIFELDISKGGG